MARLRYHHPITKLTRASQQIEQEYVAGFSNVQTRGVQGRMADSLQETLVRNATKKVEDAERTPPPVQHVKDGKPLTPLGARLLGVPWKGPGEE